MFQDLEAIVLTLSLDVLFKCVRKGRPGCSSRRFGLGRGKDPLQQQLPWGGPPCHSGALGLQLGGIPPATVRRKMSWGVLIPVIFRHQVHFLMFSNCCRCFVQICDYRGAPLAAGGGLAYVRRPLAGEACVAPRHRQGMYSSHCYQSRVFGAVDNINLQLIMFPAKKEKKIANTPISMYTGINEPLKYIYIYIYIYIYKNQYIYNKYINIYIYIYQIYIYNI